MSKTPWILDDPVEISPEGFERLVHSWLSRGTESLTDFRAEHLRTISGAAGEYKIDIAVEFTVPEGARILAFVECKHQKRPVEREQVMVLEGKLRDAGAHKGIMFSTSGFQRGALDYAATRGIATVNVQDAQSLYITSSLFPPPVLPSLAVAGGYVGVRLTPGEREVGFHRMDIDHLDAVREWFSAANRGDSLTTGGHMVEPFSLATAAAVISAMVDIIQLGKESFQEYLSRRQKDPTLAAKEQALAKAFSTYSHPEVEAILERIESCRRRFIGEGSGAARRNCLCSVLGDVRDGNGGTIPDPEWERNYDQLKCAV
jgi:restriction system protein